MNEGIDVRVESSRNFFLLVKTHIYLFIKRIFDIIVSFIGLLFIMPIGIIIKISYILHKDYSSIFYAQNRIGKDGKEFTIVKFRSMVSNADEVLKELLKDPKYKKQWDEKQKLDHDPRITRMGKIIRKLSLDELPQFVNVFLGEMSLIGPRPLIKGELDMHNGNHDIYESVRPGITGWWACNGRSCTSYEERLDLEYYYVEHMGFKMDFKCFFQTIKVVFKCKGAK